MASDAEHMHKYAVFSKLAYENKATLTPPDGWELDRSDLTNRNRSLFVNHGTKETVYAYRGTNPKNVSDLATDVALAANMQAYTSRFKNAVHYAKKVQAAYPGYKLTVTGHSLGGSQAQHVSRKLKVPAVTYAAHLPTSQIQQEALRNLVGDKTNKLHRNYATATDPVALGQTIAGRTTVVPRKGRRSAHALHHFLPDDHP